MDPAVLVLDDPNLGGEHQRRQQAAVAALMQEAAVLRGRGVPPDKIRPEEVWAAVLFNSPYDMENTDFLRRVGRPVLYCPGPGPVRGGRFYWPIIHDPSHRTSVRLKMQRASCVQADSFAQAAMIRDHYAFPGPFLITPPAVEAPPYGDPDDRRKEAWVVGVGPEWGEGDPGHWFKQRGLSVETLDPMAAAGRAALHQVPGAVLWLATEWYGNCLMEVLRTGAPAAVLENGLADDPGGVIAEWFAGDWKAGMEAALRRTSGARRAQANAAGGTSWAGWARAVLACLRQLRLSGVTAIPDARVLSHPEAPW